MSAATTAATGAATRRLPVRTFPGAGAGVTASVTATGAAALRLVPARRSSAPRAPFVTMVVLLLAGGLLGLLALNTVLAQDAFTRHTLVKENKALADREQTLEREVETLRTPRNLAERARELGMVQGSTPAFLRLADGVVLGAEVPAEAALPAEGAAPETAPSDDSDEAAAP